MFVGEAPRHGESRSEGVFARRLDELCDRLNVVRVYVTDAVKCPAPERPNASRREPTLAQRDACQLWLANEIATATPRGIVPLGATAAWAVVRALGGTQEQAGTLAGFQRQFGSFAVLKGIYICPLEHPSRVEHNRWDRWLVQKVECLRANIPTLIRS
jgi:uracil-DNA glycosylase family 4